MLNDEITVSTIEEPWERCLKVRLEGRFDMTHFVGLYRILDMKPFSHEFRVGIWEWPEPIWSYRVPEEWRRDRFFKQRVKEELNKVRLTLLN